VEFSQQQKLTVNPSGKQFDSFHLDSMSTTYTLLTLQMALLNMKTREFKRTWITLDKAVHALLCRCLIVNSCKKASQHNGKETGET
jgi:hypothetical protein